MVETAEWQASALEKRGMSMHSAWAFDSSFYRRERRTIGKSKLSVKQCLQVRLGGSTPSAPTKILYVAH